ncbi:MAG TPA: hypothetical protein VJ476_09340, partial [Rhizomicrobium sp.]|nr:hypothetical protein [Rhizomicrobium sp.]
MQLLGQTGTVVHRGARCSGSPTHRECDFRYSYFHRSVFGDHGKSFGPRGLKNRCSIAVPGVEPVWRGGGTRDSLSAAKRNLMSIDSRLKELGIDL